MQYHLRPTDRNSLSNQSVLIDGKVQPESDHDMQIALTGSQNGRPTVLVADDSDDTRQMLQVLLAGKGYQVLQASDGEQAVERVQHENPGLVLLDLGLPRLNGLRVIHRLRNELNLTDVPLIVITGYDNQFDTALAAGCDDYLVKPIDFGKLDTILDYYVPLKKNAAFA
jgi:CheY-like chemotaxis protein